MGRMLCTDCGATEVAVTRLGGSDGLEGVGWLLGGLPGWLYCGWRHALRAKRCARCGSENLWRETRASAERAGTLGPAPARIERDGGRPAWPAHLRDPRARLRRAPIWTAAWWLGAAIAPAAGPLLVAALLGVERARAWRAERGPDRPQAWDVRGRPLRIEAA